MLYSSSREDLKRSLGVGYFAGEYYANTRGDMTWDQFLEYVSRERIDGPLSVKEQLILEEKALTHSESHSTKATAMGALPFELSSSVISALGRLQSGEVNWLEMYLNQETVELAEAKEVDPKEPLQSHVCSTDARSEISLASMTSPLADFLCSGSPTLSVTPVLLPSISCIPVLSPLPSERR